MPPINPYAKRKRPPTNSGGNEASSAAGQKASSSGGSQPQPTAQPARKLENPYKQSKKQYPSSSLSKSKSSMGMEGGTGTTFSQAFGGIEDTDYFQISASEAQDSERAQQRAFEENAADEMKLSDRDHHILLQPHALGVSHKQRGNGVLNFIRNVPYQHQKMVPDFIMTPTSCALFLSCKYHSLYPQYIHRRIAELKTDFRLRILLVLVDVEDNNATLLFLNKLAVQQNMTLILAWTEEEAARYLETYKALEGNDASLIKRKEKTHFVEQATDFLAGATGVNKTDSASLLTQFTSIKAIMSASKDELGLVAGLGQVKVKRLHDAFHKPFSTKKQRERQQAREREDAKRKKETASLDTASNGDDDDAAAIDAKDTTGRTVENETSTKNTTSSLLGNEEGEKVDV